MAQLVKVCIDRILDRDLQKPLGPPLQIRGSSRAAVDINRMWAAGATLHVRLIGGGATHKEFVEKAAVQWTEYANIHFLFDGAWDAEIRIVFGDYRSWSYIGTDCKPIPYNEPTMNFAWLDKGVVLHEFGHAIGLIHEHQSPKAGINWNLEQVISDLKGPPNYWDRATTQHNIFDKYALEQTNSTVFDPESIMIYPIRATWTLDGYHVNLNKRLSETDKRFIGSKDAYPFG